MELIRKIGLGTVQFGIAYGISNTTGQTMESEVTNILDVAAKSGITVVDTAYAYGSSEKILGHNHMSRFKVISKFMPPRDQISVRSQFDESRKRLGLASLYGFLAHRPDALLQDNGSTWKYLQKLKESGEVQKIGYSLNTPDELNRLLDNEFIPDLVQVPFNYLDNRFAPYLIELKKNGCEIHTRSAFLQGLFFVKPSELPAFFDEVTPTLEKLQFQFGENLGGALLRYAAQQPFIDKVIIGVNNKDQLLQNIESLNIKADLPDLNERFSDQLLMPLHWPK